MSENMKIEFKKKYNDFIDIIDNYQENESINNKSESIQENKSSLNEKKIEKDLFSEIELSSEKNTLHLKQSNEEQESEKELKEEQMDQEQVNEEQLTQEQVKEEQTIKEQLNEEQLTQEQLNEEQAIKEQLNEEQLTQEQVKEEQLTQEQLKEEQLKESNVVQENLSNNVEQDSKSEINRIFLKLHSLIQSPTQALSKTLLKDEHLQKDFSENNSESESEKFIKKEVTKVNDLKKHTKKKTKTQKKDKYKLNEEEQKEQLEMMYEKEIYNENSTNSNKVKKKKIKDELKDFCIQLEEKYIMESTIGYSIKEDLHYINMDTLKKNISKFNDVLPKNYEYNIFYRNFKDTKIIFNSNKEIGWMELTKTDEKHVSSKNKLLSTSLRLFEKTNKFRKTINGVKVRAFKTTFLVYKTNIKIDIFALIKSLD